MSKKLENRTFLLFLFIVSCGFLWILKPFFGAIFWACAIAIIFYPIQKIFLKRWPNRPTLAALATLMLCLVVVILPLMVVINSVINEGMMVYSKIKSGEFDPAAFVESINTRYPAVNSLLLKIGVDLDNIKNDAINIMMSSGKVLAQNTFTIGQNAFDFILSLALMLYITFFMLKDGDKIIEHLIRALPLGDTRERTLFGVFTSVTRATIKGNIVIAILQGCIGGITLWSLGVHGALLLGVLMAFASLIPSVGSALVWVPVAIYLAINGETTSAIILSAIGIAIISSIDNILRPILVGRDTQLPDYIVLLSTLGGISLFGINGFAIGPLVAALFLAFWNIFMDEFE